MQIKETSFFQLLSRYSVNMSEQLPRLMTQGIETVRLLTLSYRIAQPVTIQPWIHREIDTQGSLQSSSVQLD